MTDSTTYLGVDLGTSGLKLTLVGHDGSVVAEAEATYRVRSDQAGYAETDPRDWVAGLEKALADLAPHAGHVTIEAVGVTGQMHGLVLTDAKGEPVRPAVLWPDRRAAAVLAGWSALPEGARSRLGNPLVAGMAGPMLTWLAEHEPTSLATTSLVRSPKDWLRSRLTGDVITERSDASATLLWDVVADDWSPEALEIAAVDRSMLPAVRGCDEVVGTTRLPVGANAGLEVPVVTGGADTACALTGLRARYGNRGWADAAVVNLGTGIQVVRPREKALATAQPLTHQYADTDGGWYEMLAIQNGGFALAWVQEVLRLSWDEFIVAARAAAPGAQGVRFLPFLTGERGGVAGPESTAGWSRLTASAGIPELARSAFEGLAFTVRRAVELLSPQPERLLLTGGGARDEWVRQLVTDVLGRPVDYVQLRSASAVGAAILSARSRGLHLVPPAETHTHTPRARRELESAYAAWVAATRG